MKRKDALSAMVFAGYHDDHRGWARLFVENRIAKDKAEQAFRDGARARAKGIGCGCYECKEAEKAKLQAIAAPVGATMAPAEEAEARPPAGGALLALMAARQAEKEESGEADRFRESHEISGSTKPAVMPVDLQELKAIVAKLWPDTAKKRSVPDGKVEVWALPHGALHGTCARGDGPPYALRDAMGDLGCLIDLEATSPKAPPVIAWRKRLHVHRSQRPKGVVAVAEGQARQ